MLRSMTGGKRLLLLVLLASPLASVTAWEPRQLRDDGPTTSPLWCRHTVLIYVNPSGANADFWTRDRFGWLVGYRDQNGRHEDLLFDGFLFIGFSCKGGRHLLPLADRKPAVKSDWEDGLNNYLAAVEKLSLSFQDVAQVLEKADARGKVILAIPYPDVRQASFGVVAGRELNLSTFDDRFRALKWYVDEALNEWKSRAERGLLKGATLSGFYWGHEGIRKSDDDVNQAVAENDGSIDQGLGQFPP